MLYMLANQGKLPVIQGPVLQGLLGRCPACGKGKLFAGYLKFADRCNKCDQVFDTSDTGDGPAVFVMTIVGFLVVFPALAVEKVFKPEIWVHALMWLPLSTLLVLLLLHPSRGMWYGLMFKFNAGEAVLNTDKQTED